MKRPKLRSPFPYFGGKSRVAHLVWERFGADVTNFVDPFAGSLAVVLARPGEPRVETVNDVDCMISNFWRAIQADPEKVARYVDWPVNEADLHARHRWLVKRERFRERMKSDPYYYDARIAGWWVWGISQWIGSGWCQSPEWTGRFDRAKPRGVHTDQWNGRPAAAAMGVNAIHRKRPNIGKGGRGVSSLSEQLPNISGSRGATGRGVLASALLTRTGLTVRREALVTWFGALQERLRNVRVCCGDWKRVLGPSPTVHIGVTAVFLDPPYEPTEIARGARGDGFAKSDRLYAQHTSGLSAEVAAWAREHGDNPKLRIALCGYEGEHEMPDTWQKVAWKAGGGYSNRGASPMRNAGRERIWFSKHCLVPARELPLMKLMA